MDSSRIDIERGVRRRCCRGHGPNEKNCNLRLHDLLLHVVLVFVCVDRSMGLSDSVRGRKKQLKFTRIKRIN